MAAEAAGRHSPLPLCRVSLMKNGEEVVSVGGAVDPSLKNVGTSASNSVLLDLGKVGVRGWIHRL